jgi:transposase
MARAELRGYDDPQARGRHRELSADCEQELVEWLANKAANHRAVNWTEFLHECTELFGEKII